MYVDFGPGLGFRLLEGSGLTWRFRGRHKQGQKFPDMGYKYSSPTYNPISNYP